MSEIIKSEPIDVEEFTQKRSKRGRKRKTTDSENELKAKGGKKSFQCEVCKENFMYKAGLVLHTSIKHSHVHQENTYDWDWDHWAWDFETCRKENSCQ